MPSPTTGALRWTRSVMCTLVAVALALGAHTLAGGQAPSVLALAVAVVPLACASVLATGRRIGRVGTVGGLVVAQAALHLWFSAAGGTGCSVSGGLSGVSGLGGVLTHQHAAVPGAVVQQGVVARCAGGVPASVEAVASAPAAAAPHGLWMLLAHLAAVVATGLLLAHGERLLWDAVAGVRRMLWVATPVLILPVARLLVGRSPRIAPRLPAATQVSRRGPPSVPAVSRPSRAAPA